MSEIVKTETQTPAPSLETLATEIKIIKEQAQLVILQASIEIGKRLSMAKTQVGHGNWETWLQDNVDYSQRTASNLIRIYEEYGIGQTKLFGTSINPEALEKLTYTQAITLLGIKDADERAEFINETNLEDMSTRELQQAIKEKNELQEKLTASQEKESEAVRIRDEQLEHIRGLENELKAAEKEIETQKKKAAQSEKAAADADAIGAELERLRKEVEELKSNQVIDSDEQKKRNTFADRFKEAQGSFNMLINALFELPKEDKAKYRVACKNLLVKMSEYIEEEATKDE